jgi:hypothetical protein
MKAGETVSVSPLLLIALSGDQRPGAGTDRAKCQFYSRRDKQKDILICGFGGEEKAVEEMEGSEYDFTHMIYY